MRATDEPIVVEQTFDTDIATVWKSVTDGDLMRRSSMTGATRDTRETMIASRVTLKV